MSSKNALAILIIAILGAAALTIVPNFGMGSGTFGSSGYNLGGVNPGGWSMGPGSRDISVDDVKRDLERWLAFQGNDRLKLGEVLQKTDATIEATIITKKENAVVQKFVIDRRSGVFRPTGD